MAHECYHCKRWIEDGEAHDCWTTTETALTQDLSGDLRDAYERLRETALTFGDQRIYASHNSIMFARTSCYFFVRPKQRSSMCVFLGRALKAPQVRRVDTASKSKIVEHPADPPSRRSGNACHRLARRSLSAVGPTGGTQRRIGAAKNDAQEEERTRNDRYPSAPREDVALVERAQSDCPGVSCLPPAPRRRRRPSRRGPWRPAA